MGLHIHLLALSFSLLPSVLSQTHNYPSCAQPCLLDVGLASKAGCSLTDPTCLCSTTSYVAEILCCVSRGCDAMDTIGTINEAASACAELNLYINTTVPESCKASPASKTSTSATRRLPTSSVLAANSTTQSTTGLSPALKIGIGIGVALLLIAIAIIIFFFIKLKRRRRDDRHSPLGKVGTALSPTETSYSGSGFGRPQQKMAMVTDQKGAVRGEPNMLAGYTYVPSPIVDDRLGFVQYSPGNLGANEHGHGHSRMSEVSVVTMATSAMTPTELAASPVSPQQRRPRTFEDMGVGAVETKGRHELS